MKKNPDGEKCKRQLPFSLNDEEKARKGEDAGKFNIQIEKAMDLKKSEMAKHNERITGLTKKRDGLLKAINEGVERREVSCVEAKNYEKNLIEYWFEGKVLESREMKPEERQQNLNEGKPSKKLAKWQKLAPKYEPKKSKEDERDEEVASVHRLETSKKGASSMVDPK